MSCHSAPTGQALSIKSSAASTGTITLALAGQPNMGKSTLFNLLTGLNQHVGNWPGKTVEFREGFFQTNGRELRIVDLPGTYSLTANSPEEVIAREFILRENPDVVVAVVSAANLERSLYLVSELICLPAPLVVALNMMDVADQEGIHVEPEVLQAALGVPVVPLTATRADGVHELLAEVERCLMGERKLVPHLPEIRSDHRAIMDQVIGQITGFVPAPYPSDWAAMKLLEGDAEMNKRMARALPPERWQAAQAILEQHDDAMLAIASGRYDWIGRMMRAAVTHPRLGQISLTDRIDRWATHPVWGLATLAGILGLVFWLTFTLGAPVQGLLDSVIVTPLGRLFAGLLANAPFWLRGLVVDGVIGGAGSVLTFLPIMVIFFASFGLLEDVGYMARAAYVMDNFMHMMGLHGKSFLPIFLGFGCNVPAVLGTRVIDSAQGAPAHDPGGAAGTLHSAHGGAGLHRAGLLWRAGYAGFMGPDPAGAGAAGAFGDCAQPGIVQRRALGVYHGAAAVPRAQRAHDWPAGLAAGAVVCQESRDGHPGHVGWDLGVIRLTWRQLAEQLPGETGRAGGAGGRLDGDGLEADSGAADQFPGQRKRDCHAGRAVWARRGCQPGPDAGRDVFAAHGPGLPDRIAAVHPLRRDGGGHPPGDRFVALDAAQHRFHAGAVGGGGGADVYGRLSRGLFICRCRCRCFSCRRCFSAGQVGIC